MKKKLYELSLHVIIEEYRKIPKINPSKYKPPKPVTQKNPPLNGPSLQDGPP